MLRPSADTWVNVRVSDSFVGVTVPFISGFFHESPVGGPFLCVSFFSPIVTGAGHATAIPLDGFVPVFKIVIQ